MGNKLFRFFDYLFNNPKLLLLALLDKIAYILPDKLFLKVKFRLSTGYSLNLDCPRSFNEKLQWLKLNDKREEYTRMVDKVDAKFYVASLIGEKYIIPTLGIWNRIDDITWDDLPKQFVIKATNDSGGVIVCKDKNSFDIRRAIKVLRVCGKRNYYFQNREYPYKNVSHRFIAEAYLEDESGYELKDYKFFCFHGEPSFVQVASNISESDVVLLCQDILSMVA